MATTANIEYSGKLQVTVRKDGVVVDKRVYENAGTNELFKFLCYCIKGDFNDEMRPFKVRLYHNNYPYSPDSLPDTSMPVSAFIAMNKPATVRTYTNSEGKEIAATTLHFLIPYSSVTSTSEGDAINQACLYAVRADNSMVDDYMAYYYFIDATGSS